MSSMVIKQGEGIAKKQDFSEVELGEGEVFKLTRYVPTQDTSLESPCEIAGRIAPSEGGSSGGVAIFAVLKQMLKYDCLIMLKQFRPALRSFTLELPLALVNATEDPEEAARQELHKLTGYASATVKHTSPFTAANPCVSKSINRVVSLEVDGAASRHYPTKLAEKNAKDIEVVSLPIYDLLKGLNGYSDKGVIIDSTLYAIAIGLTMGTKSVTHIETANPY